MAKMTNSDWRGTIGWAQLAFTFWNPLGWGVRALGIFNAGTAYFTGLLLKDKQRPAEITSPSYGWDHKENRVAAQDTPMPIVYGSARVKPVVKNSFNTRDGDKEYRHVLYSLTGHRIDQRTVASWVPNHAYVYGDEVATPNVTVDSISVMEPGKTYVCRVPHVSGGGYDGLDWLDREYWKVGPGTASVTGVRINDTPIETFLALSPDDFSYETRPGLYNQTIMDGFENTHNSFPQDAALYRNRPEVNPGQIWMTDISDEQPEGMLAEDEYRFYYGSFQVYYLGTEYPVDGGYAQCFLYSLAPKYYMTWRTGDSKAGFSYTRPTAPNVFVLGVVQIDSVMEDDPDSPDWGTLVTKPVWTIPYYSLNSGYDLRWPALVWPPQLTGFLLTNDDDWTTVDETLTNCHNIMIELEFPNGLYSVRSGASLIPNIAVVFAQYRVVGTSAWYDFVFQSPEPFDAGIGNDTNYGVMRRESIDPVKITIQARGNAADNSVDSSNFLDPDETYEVRVTVASASTVRLSNVETVLYGVPDADGIVRGLTYPGEALLGIHALATGRLSGSLETTAVVARSTVPIYDTGYAASGSVSSTNFSGPHRVTLLGMTPRLSLVPQQVLTLGVADPAYDGDYTITSVQYVGTNSAILSVAEFVSTGSGGSGTISTDGAWTDKPATSHAWACVDALINGSPGHPDAPDPDSSFPDRMSHPYGAGRPQSSIVYEQFLAWHTAIHDELGWRCNTVFDEALTVWEAITRLFTEGRGSVQPIGNYFTAAVDAASDYVATLGENSIIEGTIEEGWNDITKRPNSIEVTYYDADRSHRQVTFAALSSVIDTDSEPYNPTSIVLYTHTSYAQALAYAFYLRNCAEELAWSVSGLVEIDKLSVMAGDVIRVRHPEVGDGTSYYLFRVIKAERAGDYRARLYLLEYNAAVYTIDPAAAISDPLSVAKVASVAPVLALPAVNDYNTASGLRLKELISQNRATGEYESSVAATWRSQQVLAPGECYNVVWRDVDASDGNWEGEWDPATLYGALDKVTYDGDAYVSMIDGNVGNTPGD